MESSGNVVGILVSFLQTRIVAPDPLLTCHCRRANDCFGANRRRMLSASLPGLPQPNGRDQCRHYLIQVDADYIVWLEFVRDCAVAYAGHHGCHAFALFHEILVADRVIETLTESDIAEFDTTTE